MTAIPAVRPGTERLQAEGHSLSVALASFSFLTLGTVMGAAFHSGLYLEVVPGVITFWLLTIVAIRSCRLSRLSLLPRFLIVVYAFPFSALLGYLFTPDFLWIFSPHGREIIADTIVVRQMISVGTVGLCGLAAGIHAARFRPVAESPRAEMHKGAMNTLGFGVFVVLVAMAVGLSWLSTPAETIFQKAYMTDQEATAATRINFAAASLVSYILIVCLAIDIEREIKVDARRNKLLALGFGTAYIVIVFQVLRGDRESSGLIVALSALYLTSTFRTSSHRAAMRAVRKRIMTMVVPLLVVIVVFITLGSARYLIVAGTQTIGPLAMIQIGLAENTWTAVLWRNLGMAWEYRHGLLHFRLGETYLEYLLSLPPGMVTNAFGIARPFESWQGLSHEDPAGISVGGLHVVIAPFKNFGMAGALLILSLYGWIAGRLEILNIRPSLMTRLLWASVMCCGFFWFWYGDMVFIRALMASFLIYWLYRLALSAEWITRPIRPTGRATSRLSGRHDLRNQG